MANTPLGFTDTIQSRKILEHAVPRLMALTAFSVDFSPEAVNPGEKITIPITNRETTTHLKVVGADYAIDDITGNSATITLPKEPTYVSMHVTDTERALYGSVLTTDMFAFQKAYALTSALLATVLAKVTAANYGAPKVIGAPSQWNSDALCDILPDLENAGFPIGLCSLVTSPAYYWALVKSIGDTSKLGSDTAIRSGIVPGLFGLRQVISCSAIPNNGESLVGFLAHPSAMGVAMRYLQPQDGNTYNVARSMTDADTGITLGERKWYSNDKGDSRHVIEAIMGTTGLDYLNADKTQNGIIRLTSAA